MHSRARRARTSDMLCSDWAWPKSALAATGPSPETCNAVVYRFCCERGRKDSPIARLREVAQRSAQ